MALQVAPPNLPQGQDDTFSDCVWAQVETALVNQSAARIIVTISLGTAEVTPWGLGGKVRFGLVCAKLRLRAKGGEIPHEGRWPEHNVETTVSLERTEDHRQKGAMSSKSGAKVEVGAAVPVHLPLSG